MDAERFRKFACLVHFKHDVAAPHEGRPRYVSRGIPAKLIAVATPEVGFKGSELRRFAPHASDDTPLSVVNWLVRETYPAMSDDTALLFPNRLL